jgi:Carboxypeptidase regulatory-like domain
MYLFKSRRKSIASFTLLLLVGIFSCLAPDARADAIATVNGGAGLGTIRGIVRDESGSPISDAIVAVFRLGTSQLLKQVRSDAGGGFLAKVAPGTYTVLAVAEGFNPVTLQEVQVNKYAELSYGFKLARSGSGNTLPEKKADRNSSKWRIRAAQLGRSVYQHGEGADPIDENDSSADESTGQPDADVASVRKGQTVVETFAGSSTDDNFAGFDFATLQPLGENSSIILAGQTGSRGAPQSLRADYKFRAAEAHQIRFSAAAAELGKLQGGGKDLGQLSFQALDEWKVKDGIILVVGFDYSRFVGAGSDSSVTPRLGLQYDINSKTRLRTGFSVPGDDKSWSHAIDLEDASVVFRDPARAREIVVEDSKPLINRSSRLEFGIERIIDKKSNLEATAFFDTAAGSGVGILSLPFASLSPQVSFVASNRGRSVGARAVYTRRINNIFSASGGYALGRGQRLSAAVLTSPANVFEGDFFQTFVGQLNASLKSGTQIQAVYRLSPDAAVFAIDPFHGRLAIFDPGLSIQITQSLPTLGLPIRAEAVIDGRNLLDFQTGITGDDGSLRLNSQRRSLRGGISVRF